MYTELHAAWTELTGSGGPFEIVESDVMGQQLRCYKNAPPSLREFWLASAAHGSADYLVYDDERITYTEAHRQVAQVATWLMNHDVVPGDRVAIAMRNYPEWMLTYWACVSIGVACVGMNAWWVGPEMAYGINDAQPKVIVADEERLARIREIHGQIGDPTLVAVRTPSEDGTVPWSDLVVGDAPLPAVVVDPDDDACIFYTSGTTGLPKGAQLTHRGCVANVMSIAFMKTVADLAIARAAVTSPVADDVELSPAALVTTPLFHVTANNCVAQATTLVGGKLVHMYKWDAAEALRLIEREQVTGVTGVPVMARELIAHPDFARRDTSSLSSLGGGGAQVQPDLVRRIEAEVATARPSTGYGMTETCGIITALASDFFVDRPDSAGPAMPCFDAKCVDDEGTEVPTGDVGELWVKGSQIIKGYLNRPDDTAESIVEGWLRTGDIARMDEDRFIYIVDRAKDMVLRGGENVFCAEVENAIFDHEDVAECAVFGVPDDRLGEEVAAAVFLTSEAAVDAGGLRAHLHGAISKHKVPRYIWLVQAPLPRNASGKFLKRDLRDSLELSDAQ